MIFKYWDFTKSFKYRFYYIHIITPGVSLRLPVWFGFGLNAKQQKAIDNILDKLESIK